LFRPTPDISDNPLAGNTTPEVREYHTYSEEGEINSACKVRVSTFTNEESSAIENYLRDHTKEELQQPACVIVTDVFRGFYTEQEEGHYLVVKDNTYMKKNLPAQAAQMIVLKWNSTGNDVADDFLTKFEANFPFLKIQGLIDN
jgi:hypothetical protein